MWFSPFGIPCTPFFLWHLSLLQPPPAPPMATILSFNAPPSKFTPWRISFCPFHPGNLRTLDLLSSVPATCSMFQPRSEPSWRVFSPNGPHLRSSRDTRPRSALSSSVCCAAFRRSSNRTGMPSRAPRRRDDTLVPPHCRTVEPPRSSFHSPLCPPEGPPRAPRRPHHSTLTHQGRPRAPCTTTTPTICRRRPTHRDETAGPCVSVSIQDLFGTSATGTLAATMRPADPGP